MFPPELAQVGEVAIIAAALLGLVYAIKPLIAGFVQGQRQLADVNRELLRALQAADRSQDRNSEELRQLRETTKAQTDALKAQTEAMTAAMERHAVALAELVKSQSDAATRITTAQDVTATQTIASLNATIASHDHEVMTVLGRIEGAVNALRTEFADGHRAASKVTNGKLDQILAELMAMRPPPSTPKVLPLHPVDAEEVA